MYQSSYYRHFLHQTMDQAAGHKDNGSAIILPLLMSDRYYQAMLTVYALGALGNILSIIVFSRKTFRGSTSCLSHQLLCLMETVYMGIVSWGVTLIHSQAVLSKTTCLTLFYLMHVPNVICNWLVVLVTIERLTSVILPMRIRILWTKKRLVIIFCAMSVVTIVLYSGLFLMSTQMDLLATNSSSVFACLTHYTDFQLEAARNWLEIIFMHSLPCIILFIGNGLIIIFLSRHRAFLRRHGVFSSHMSIQHPTNNNMDVNHMTLDYQQTAVKKTPHDRVNTSSKSETREFPGISSLTLDIESLQTRNKLKDTHDLISAHQEEALILACPSDINISTISSPQFDHDLNKDLMQFKTSSTLKTSIDGTRNGKDPKHSRKMSHQSQNGQLRRETAMTVTLLLINFTFLGTKAPYFIHIMILPGFPGRKAVLTLEEAELKLHFIILSTVFNALSFILYCLAGSKFREELSHMVCEWTLRLRHPCKI